MKQGRGQGWVRKRLGLGLNTLSTLEGGKVERVNPDAEPATARMTSPGVREMKSV